MLAPSCPFPPENGVHLRVHGLLRRLPAGVEVDLLCFDAAGPRESPLPEPYRGTLVRIPPPPLPSGWRAHPLVQLFRREPTLVWKFRSRELNAETTTRSTGSLGVLAVGLQMAPALDWVAPRVPGALDDYNIEWRILDRLAGSRSGLRRLYWKWEAAKMRRAERALLLKAWSVFAISEVDWQGLRELVPERDVLPVPMGIDRDFFRPPAHRRPPDTPHFCFVAAFNWHVNEDAALWLCGEVWPRVRAELPEARLSLVGRDPSPAVRELAALPGVTVTGTVEDVRPYVWDSTASLVPLRYGSGVRTKILEAFAAGVPVVSTPVGAEGLRVRDGEHLLLAGDAAGFAAACVRLAREPEVSPSLTTAAAEFAAEQDRRATAAYHAALLQAFRGFPGLEPEGSP